MGVNLKAETKGEFKMRKSRVISFAIFTFIPSKKLIITKLYRSFAMHNKAAKCALLSGDDRQINHFSDLAFGLLFYSNSVLSSLDFEVFLIAHFISKVEL
jgi:hypothetical protein